MPAKRPHRAGARRPARHPSDGDAPSFGSRTDVGCVREHNEDSLAVAPPLFIVADGMGGHAAGEVASEIAVRTISRHAPEHPDAHALGKAVEEANRAIIEASLSNPKREGMGTTCTAALLEGERLVIAQVGDSRAYLFHDGRLQQVTRDHSLVANMIEAGQITPEEARTHPQRSVITRALGNDPACRPDLYELTVQAGDRILLCSDGLSSMVSADAMQAVLTRALDPQRCASQLVNAAIAAGGLDNVTVVVVDACGLRPKEERRGALKARLGVAVILLLLAGTIAGAAFGVRSYLHHVAFLAEEDGMVAVYRGVPGQVLGFSYAELMEKTDVAVSDLPAGTAERIADNLRVGSVEEAEGLIDQFRSDIDDRARAQKQRDATQRSPNDGAEQSSASRSNVGESGRA